MKAIRYIAALALLAGFISCQREAPVSVQQPEDGFVEVTFPVSFASPALAPTRAPMGEGPTTADFNLYLCVYGPGEGFVQNWIKAMIVNLEVQNGFVVRGTYKAMLPLADDQRTIHFIVNPPATANPTLTDYIDNVMENMVDTDKECSYWQEIILPNITTDPLSVKKLTDGVNLVRNFAKITVDKRSDQPFEVLQWALINVPDKGYVAPYNPNNKYTPNAAADAGERYPSAYLNENILALANATDGSLFTQLYGREEGQDNYPAYLPAGTTIVGDATRLQEEFDAYPGEPGAGNTNYVLGGAPLYMYERPVPATVNDRPTAVLVQIQFEDGAEPDADPDNLTPDRTYWYKIEVLDNEGAYIPFYRDVVYRMEIASIEEVGSKTAFDAFSGGYFGNISASVETASLTDLSNKDSQIHVDQLDYTFVAVNPDGKELLMFNGDAARFYFIPNLENPTDVYVKDEPGVCNVSVQIMPVAGFEPAVSAIEVNGPNGEGTIVVTLTEQTDAMKKSVIRVTGKKTGGQAVYREITINLMKTPSFVHGTVSTSVETPSGVGSKNLPVNVTIQLPENLGPSLFPIQVRFEAENNTLTALSPDLPVVTGKSAFDPDRNTYFFVRTIKYSEYCHLNNKKKWVYNYEFPVTFFTSRPGDNSTRLHISDVDNNFNAMILDIPE